jgi:glutathione S-transferase
MNEPEIEEHYDRAKSAALSSPSHSPVKLYYFPGACSLASHIVLEWLGAPYETVRMSRQSIKEPPYLALNPFGTVPLLVHGAFSLTETVAILGYLADLHPLARLLGDGTPRGRAEVTRWLAFLNSDVHKAFKPIFVPGRFLPEPSFAPALAAAARPRVRACFERLDARLHGRDWLADQRSVVDPYLFVMLRWTIGAEVDVRDLQNLARFTARMERDPGVRTAIRQEESGAR